MNEEIKSKKNFTTSVAIGGWNEGSEKYSRAFSDDSKRKKFAQNAREFTIKYGFDGFDLDWEYPNQRGGVPADTANFCALIKEMREEFDKYGLRLTAAVSANAATNPTTYDIPCLNRYLHEINVMTYDLHGSWDPTTGHQAALTASEADIRLGEGHLCVVGFFPRFTLFFMRLRPAAKVSLISCRKKPSNIGLTQEQIRPGSTLDWPLTGGLSLWQVLTLECVRRLRVQAVLENT